MAGTSTTPRLITARRRPSRLLTACGLLSAVVAGISASASDPIVIHSKTTRFRIPFQVDQDEIERLQATEVQLYLSDDAGQNWRRLDGVAPSVGKFYFEAPGDGNYWFAVKTVAGRGRVFPPGPHVPGLQVIVDSVRPTLELNLEETAPGQVLLSWKAEDRHLNLSTLEILYQEPGNSEWQAPQSRPEMSGRATWTVKQAGPILVRGRVEDAAGNVAEAETSLIVAQVPDRPEKPDFSRPVAGKERRESAAAANTSSNTGGFLPLPLKLNRPGDDSTARPEDPPLQANAIDPVPKFTRTSVPSRETPPASVETGLAAHIVNATNFRIGYEFENVGPSGIGEVQLYITENDGEEWFHYGRDPDRTSPFVVTVPKEGNYGFSFRISNGVGYVGDPPQPRENPDVRVIVDLTPPAGTVRVRGQGAGMERVARITWTTEDNRQSAEGPVSLYYSGNRSGPWQLISEGEAASGEILWTPPRDLDQQAFVRIRVADAAGNIAQIDADQSLPLDHSQPKARVIGIEAAAGKPAHGY